MGKNLNKLVIQSYAKVNLFLEVLNKRSDNYHNLDTLFERISLSDTIILRRRKDKLIKISCSHPQVPLDASNLCFKAAKLLQDEFGINRGVDVKIIKRIPVGAGLGGGSSNAASVLIGLNKLWKLQITKARLAKLASRIGSDVAFFVYEIPFAQGKGRGERIRVLLKLKKIKLWHVLIVPKVAVSTPRIYAEFDNLYGSIPKPKQLVRGLTNPVLNVKILTSVLLKKTPFSKLGFLFNNLEEATFKLYPEVRRAKQALLRLGLKQALMSGSGSAVFALCSSGEKAAALIRKIRKEAGAWLVFAVRTI